MATDPPRVPSRSGLVDVAAKAIPWVLGILITAVLVPLAVRPWSDRPKALELKSGLISSLSHSIADSVDQAHVIADGAFPQSIDRRFACRRRLAKTSACHAARVLEKKTALEAYTTLHHSWLVTSAELQGKLEAYFPNTDLLRHGSRYLYRVGDYLR